MQKFSKPGVGQNGQLNMMLLKITDIGEIVFARTLLIYCIR